MANQKLPNEVIDKICELRARDVLYDLTDHEEGQPWSYSQIQQKLDLNSDWPIGKYAGQAGLTNRTPEAQRIRNAKKQLGLTIDTPPDQGTDPDPNDTPDETTRRPDTPTPDEATMPLDEDGVDGFLPDTTDDPPPPPSKETPTMPEDPPDPSESTESTPPEKGKPVIKWTCRGCGNPYHIRSDELGDTVECPYDQCDREVKVPTEAQLVQKGLITR